jgi:hypothetical protein
MRDKNATGDYVTGDALKLFGKDGFRIMTLLIDNTNDTGQWPKNVTEATLMAWQKPKATKCSDHRTHGKDGSENT